MSGVRVVRKGVVPGPFELRIVVSDEESKGARITGNVISAASGKRLTTFRQWLIEYRTDTTMAIGSETTITSATGTFRSPPLSLGGKYALAIASDECAARLAGPITITAKEHHFDLALEEFGELRVRVIESDGSPAAAANSRFERKDAGVPSTTFYLPKRTDEGGVTSFPKLAPGEYEVSAWRKPDGRSSTTVTVLPGKRAEIEIRLPR